MIAILLALSAAVSWGTGDYLGGIASRRFALLWVLLAPKVWPHISQKLRLRLQYLDPKQSKKYAFIFGNEVFGVNEEAINNAIKYADSTHIIVQLSHSNNILSITIDDNGKGFDDLQKNSIDGYGINRIKARINNMKGEFVIKSKKNQGTTIKLIIPVA